MPTDDHNTSALNTFNTVCHRNYVKHQLEQTKHGTYLLKR